MCYNRLRHCPTVILVTAFAGSLVIYLLAQHWYSLPSFDDPLLGFEVRRSDLANRINTWGLLIESTAWNGPLSLSPRRYTTTSTSITTTTAMTTTIPKNSRVKNRGKKPKKNRKNKNKFNRKKENKQNPIEKDRFNSREHQNNGRFCGEILEDYVHVILKRTDNGNLFELKTLKSICHLDSLLLRMEMNNEVIANGSHFTSFCEIQSDLSCCASWSLPNYILSLANKTDCDHLIEEDIDYFLDRLSNCADYFANRNLNERCQQNSEECPNVQTECIEPDNFVYNIFNYLVDYRFLDMNQVIYNQINKTRKVFHGERPFLQSTSIFLPMAKSTKLMPYYETLINMHQIKWNVTFSSSISTFSYLTLNNVQIVGADLGLKRTLFSDQLVVDLMLNVLSGVLILLLLFIYTQSILLTLVALIVNLLSLGSAYFVYKVIFQIEFFPFLNLLTIAILIGIGSDNVLIYCKAWSCCMEELRQRQQSFGNDNKRKLYKKSQNELMDKAFRHVSTSSLCASLTTCCAFFVGYFAEITSLKCFAIFAGTTILTNFLLTITTFLSALIISDKLSKHLPKVFQCQKSFKWLTWISLFLTKLIFDRLLLKLIVYSWCRYIVIFLFSMLSILSGIIVFYHPGLTLPETQDFQVFTSDHIFEAYDLRFRNEFWYNRYDRTLAKIDPALQLYGLVLPIRVVFGVHPIDNGNILNPFDRGKLVYDPAFDISTPAAQSWLLHFCHKLLVQPFVRQMIGPMLSNCFIQSFKVWMKDRPCFQQADDQADAHPCCERSDFPFPPAVFNQCLPIYIERLQKTPKTLVTMTRAGPRFDSSGNGRVKAIVIEYDSIFDQYNNNFTEMTQLWLQMNDFVEAEMTTAPKELQSGWLTTSNMEFFSLQKSLYENATKSIGVQVICAFLIMILITWNFCLSLLSIISIASTILSTLATLIMLGWRLNIIESITISLTIGLAIDSTLHYTIAYKLLTNGNRLLGIQRTVARIGSPVAMGALTTFVAGAGMMPSSIEAYRQIGTFLMVLSCCSWIYSTLFHLCLLFIFGGQSNGTDCSLIKCFQTKAIVTPRVVDYDLNDNTQNHFIEHIDHEMKAAKTLPIAETIDHLEISRYDVRNYKISPKLFIQQGQKKDDGDYATFKVIRSSNSNACLHVTSI